MSPALWLVVGLLGGLGAVARFLLDGAVTRRTASPVPLGTLAVNLSGALLLGVLAGTTLDHDAELLLGAALLGSYTTFSTWMLETVELGRARRTALAVLNVVGSIALGLAAVWLGRQLGGGAP